MECKYGAAASKNLAIQNVIQTLRVKYHKTVPGVNRSESTGTESKQICQISYLKPVSQLWPRFNIQKTLTNSIIKEDILQSA